MIAHELISVVVPVRDERETIADCLRGIARALEKEPYEILVCYDRDDDATLPAAAAMTDRPTAVRMIKNGFGPGAANAIRAGFAAATGDVVVVTMADLCDPPDAIPVMAEEIRQRGADVVSGSRYMKGGSQTGGPRWKSLMSRAAGWVLQHIGGVPTGDATTNFRAFSRRFLDRVKIESRAGMQIGLELTVKAHRAGFVVSEVPAAWTCRTAGVSKFRVWRWLPGYLRWCALAMARPAVIASMGAVFVIIVILALARAF